MADENIVTNIVANADFSGLIADVNKVTASLSKLQQSIIQSDQRLANQVSVINRSFAESLRRTGQFSTHFVTLTSDVEKFGKNLDGGKLKLRDYFRTFQDHTKTSGGLIRELAKQQVALQNAIVQPLGKNAQGLMQYNVHIPQGLNNVKNKAALARQELQILNKVVQDGGVQLINWGKNTQWAGRQLTVGLTVPLAAFGKAAADAFRMADQELTRLTKVYGGLAQTSAAELGKVRDDVTKTARELSSAYGVSFKETVGLAADIAATGKQGNELLGSIKETSRLAVLGEVDRQEAMKATLAIQSAFKQNTDELSASIDFLNAVENQTSTTLADLVEAIPKAGPVIQGLGGSVKDLALYLTAMKEGGVNASEGANAIKSSLASLINPTKVATQAFADLGIDLKGIVASNAGNLTATLMELQGALNKLDPLQKQQALEQLFGKFQFARLNALFSNLGQQGSQTLKVLDLMKTSTSDLGKVADRELKAVTESASGKYKRAIESLRADLAQIGEDFLKVQTFFINVTDSIVKFVNNLPGPIKQILTFAGGLTAVIGPVIMLTGVLANFFGYIIKGVSHFKALFRGGEGWKMLTPEILAAEKAGSLIEKTFYSDAKAASVLKTSIESLIAEFNLLEQKAKTGAISLAPAFSTMAGNTLISGRQVNPNHPLLSPTDTRSMSHMNPVAGMSADEKLRQTIFGVLPGAPKINQKIGNAPQMYMDKDLPKIPGLTSVGGVSTGVVAEEAAKWHAMTGALAMQSEAEIALLKREVATTGLITHELSGSYQALLPSMTQLTQNAAKESAAIVAELQAGKLTVDQARAKIVALNAQVEAMIAQTATQIAGEQGRSIALTSVPLLNQPVVNAAGKSNMKELARPGRTRDLLNKIARGLGVKTFGAPYSIETTMPKRFATGNLVPGTGNQDTVPAMLTPGEFVVNAKSTAANLPLLMQINGGPGNGGPGFNDGGFMPAKMLWQGSQANAILAHPGQAGRRSTLGLGAGNTIPGSVFAQDFISLQRQGVHPAGLMYDIGTRLGYSPKEMRPAFKAMNNDLIARLMNAGDISPKEYDRISNEVIGKHLNSIRRTSPAMGRVVSLQQEIETLGFSRNSRNKGIAPGSLRQLGFDGVSIPQPLISTGGGMPASMASAHFARMQELFDEDERKTSPAFGTGKTFKSLFGAERGHIGSTQMFGGMHRNPALSGPSVAQTSTASHGRKAFLGMPLRRIGNKWASYKYDPIKEALNTRMKFNGRLFRNKGGIIPGVQYLNEGGVAGAPALSQGFMANARYSRNRMTNFGSGMGGSGIGAQIGIGMGSSLAGQMVGGTTGQAIQIAGLAASFLPVNKLFLAIRGIVSSGSALKSIAGILGRIAPPAIVISSIAAVAQGLWVWKRHAEDVGKAHRAMYGPTAKAMQEVGLSYTSFSDKLKEVQDQLKLTKESNISAFESLNKTGVSGLTLTIKELKEAVKNAKETAKETIQDFNKVSGSGEVIKLAASLKQQYISAGMSVEEATNKIYAIIKASDKGAYAISAITSKAFTSITDKASAAQYQVELLIKTLSDKKGFNPEELSVGIDNMLNSLMSYQQSLVGTKDSKNQEITQEKSVQMTLEKIKTIKGSNLKLDEKTVDQIKNQNLVLGSVLAKNETLVGVYAKAQLLMSGFGSKMNLKGMDSNTAAQIASGMEAWSEAATAAAQDTKGPLSSINNKYNELTTSIKNSTNSAKKLSDTSWIDKQIKALDKLIKKIKDETDARLKALDVQQKNADIEEELRQAQLEYTQAVSVGDMAGAAKAKMTMQKLMDDRARELARQAIIDKSDAELKKAEAERNRLNDLNNESQIKANQSQTNANNLAATQSALATFRATIANLTSGETKETLGQKGSSMKTGKELAGAVDNAIKALIDAGGAAKTEAEALKKKYGIDGKGSISGEFKLLKDMANLTGDKASSGAFSDAVSKFVGAVNKFAKSGGMGTGTSASPYSMGVVAGLTPQQWQTPMGGFGMNSTRQQIKKYAEKQGFVSGDHFTLASGNKSDKTYKEYKFRVQDDGNIMLVDTKMGGYGAKMASGGLVGGYNGSGLIVGPGTGTSDSVPILASNGEYMFSAAAVKNIGIKNLEMLHNMGKMGPAYNIPGQSKFTTSGRNLEKNNNATIINNNMSVYAQPGQSSQEIASIAVSMIETKMSRSARQNGQQINYGGRY